MRAQGKDKTQEREEFTWTDMSMISEQGMKLNVGRYSQNNIYIYYLFKTMSYMYNLYTTCFARQYSYYISMLKVFLISLLINYPSIVS